MSRGRLTAQRLLRTTADRCTVIHVATNQVREHHNDESADPYEVLRQRTEHLSSRDIASLMRGLGRLVATNQVRAHNETGATLEERHNYYQEEARQRRLRSIADMEYAASQERPVLTRNEMDQVFDELRQYRWAMEPGAAERLRSGFRRTYFVREGQLQSQVET